MDNPTLEQVLPKQEDIQLVDINLIKPHPKNYKKHPQDQLEHICKSIRENGIYRNILIANDNIILAGHGVYEACKRMGFTKVPTLKINLNSSDPKAMKLLVSDNEIGHLAEIDQISLSETLKSIMDNNIEATDLVAEAQNNIESLISKFDELGIETPPDVSSLIDTFFNLQNSVFEADQSFNDMSNLRNEAEEVERATSNKQLNF